jgi:hypothetical protein
VALSVLDVRDVPVAPAPAATRPGPAIPAAVLATAVLSGVESVALLAAALSGLNGLLTSSPHPNGALVGLVLVGFAGWIVACAGGAATLVDGAGRRLVNGVAYAELALVGVSFPVGLLTPGLDALLPGALPLPAVALLALAVPSGKLLLAGSPATLDFLAAGPRVRERRPDPTRTYSGLCTATLAVIAVVLGALVLLAPAETGGTDAGVNVSSAR